MIGNLAVGIQDFVIPAPLGDFESIATVTVGSGGAADIEFTSIPGTYQHLQLRLLLRDNRSGSTLNNSRIQFNADTGSNYSWHILAGDGSSAISIAGANEAFAYANIHSSANATASIFGVAVLDILDYANTNKYSTLRSLSGIDNNGSGSVRLYSGNWRNTNAITSIKIYPETSGSYIQYSHAALYGLVSA